MKSKRSWQRFLPRTLGGMSFLFPKLAARLAIEKFLRPTRFQRPKEEVVFWSEGQACVFASGCHGRIYGSQHGKTIWFVHGWASRGSRFFNIVRACEKAGFKCIVWDGPAHGDSKGKRTHLVAFTRALLKDIEHQELWGIVGYSFGGSAAALSIKMGLVVQRLVLIASPSSLKGIFSRFCDLLHLSPKTRTNFNQLVELETGMGIDEASSQSFSGFLPPQTLIIHDKDDAEIPFDDAQQLKKLNQKFHLYMTTGLGHRRILVNQNVSQEITKFLG